MADYSVGNLELKIQTVGESSTASLSSVNKQLQIMLGLITPTTTLFKDLSTTAKSMSRMTFNWTNKLVKGLNDISNVDTKSFYTKISSLNRILTPFVDKLIQAQTSLVALSNVLKSTSGKKTIQLPNIVNGIDNEISKNNSITKISKSLNFGSLLGKLYFIRNYTRQLGRGIANMVQNAIDYTETLNKWQVAMGKNVDVADEFISKMNKAYGISEQTLMNYQATFKNMLTTLGGISDLTGEQLSEYLTQMALDYASLYNTSIEKAMTVFQSVLSGQVRPIRSISGYDITENTIYQLYQELGGEKNMRALSQTEKRLLRIYAVFQQMDRSGAIGDLNKTFENSANQLRVMSEQAKELSQWLGIMMEMWIKPMLPYINAILIMAKEIVKAIAIASGYKAFDGTIAGLEEVNEELDKATGKLLSFDKFESLNSGGEDNMLGIDEKLLGGLSQYSSLLNNVSNKTQELVNEWLPKWVDEEGKLTDYANNFFNVLKAISSILISLVAIKVGKGIFGILTTGYKNISLGMLEIATTTKGLTTNTTLLGKAFSLILNHPIILVIGAIAGVLIHLYNTNENFRKSVNNLFKAFSPLFSLLGDLVSGILKPLVPLLEMIISIITPIATFLIKDITLGISGVALALVPVAFILELIIKLIQSVVTGLKDIATFNWGNFGKNQSEIWSNWKSVDFAKNSWGNFKSSMSGMLTGYATGGLVEDGIFTMNKGEVMGTFDDGTSIVANNQQIIDGIKAGVYQAVVSANQQSGNSSGGDVYMDGTKVGKVVTKGVYNEGVRVGYFSKV